MAEESYGILLFISLQLAPLFFCIGFGALFSSGYLLRLAFRSPDVTWNTKRNPEPWNEYKDKEYKVCYINNNENNKNDM